jgi:hypothetical protein
MVLLGVVAKSQVLDFCINSSLVTNSFQLTLQSQEKIIWQQQIFGIT